jgi:3-isopropylmalate/(R)-2-methylmalate dehydratase small subunit
MITEKIDAPQFQTLTSHLAPLGLDDIDTDQIIPAEYLKATGRDGLAEGLFALWREDPAFVLNREEHRGAQILLAGHNFGCGSSREHAPWALLEHGFRAMISTHFADIFRANALGNGLLPVQVSPAVSQALFTAVQADPKAEATVDLGHQILTLPDGRKIPFRIDPFARTCLLEGVDALGYLLEREEDISRFETTHQDGLDTRLLDQPGPTSS